MSNLSVCATTTPYPVSNFSIGGSSSTTTYMSSSTTSKTASTTSVVTSSTTIKTVSSSTTISASTTAVKVATSSNTATISASTTSSYGTSSSNSISRQISSSTTTQSSSTTISSISRGAHVGSTPIVVNSSSTTPTASTTPQKSTGTTQTVVSNTSAGTLERNGTTITILNSSSTTPPSSSGTPIEQNGGYITIYPNKPQVKITYTILETKIKELQGRESLNELEVYSKEDAEVLLNSVREEYKSYMSRFCGALELSGTKVTGNIEIPMGELQAPNFSVKFYAELSGSSTGEETPVELNASMNKFLEEEVSVDKLIDEFALTFAEGAEIKIDESRDRYITLQNDDIEITINYTAMARKKLEISVSKSYSLSDTLDLSMNIDISMDIDDEFFKQVQTCSAEAKNEIYRQVANENLEWFNPKELFEIYKGVLDKKRLFIDLFDVAAGMDSEDKMNESKIKSDIKEKMDELINEGE